MGCEGLQEKGEGGHEGRCPHEEGRRGLRGGSVGPLSAGGGDVADVLSGGERLRGHNGTG